MPTTLFGLAFYVLALFPGVAFGFAREGHHPSSKRSVVRETASVVLVSTICNAAVGFVVAIVALFSPALRAELSAMLQGNLSWPRGHLLESLTFVVLFIGIATLIGFALGTKRADDWGLGKIWRSEIDRDKTAWTKVLNPVDAVKVQVGLTLSSGTWISGKLFDFDPNPDPDPTRTITLTGDIFVRAAGADDAVPLTGTDWIVVEAGDIEILQVSYLANE